LPEIAPEAVQLLKDLIELDDGLSGRYAADLLAEIQVQRSRLAATVYETPITSNVRTYIIDAAVVYALSVALLQYARRDLSSPSEVNGEAVVSALRNMGFWSSEYQNLRDAAVRRRVRGMPNPPHSEDS
jgi:hypothetical protein